jgi:divinyl protochlorophyllide a 8-vinyl-reductase
MAMAGLSGVAVARIGPNAITQLVGVLDRAEGRGLRDAVMSLAAVSVPDPAKGMIPECDAASVHLALRHLAPDRAAPLLRLAGLATGSYILRHRIPPLAQMLIRALPASLGARVLTAAIARHAWTFAGSGAFSVASRHPLTFEVTANPLVAHERAAHPICDWHVAVFEQLFAELVWPDCVVREVACCAMGHPACRFEILPHGDGQKGRA